jgi:hypothetical protein
MRPSRYLLTALATAALAITACGSSSPADEIRTMEYAMIDAAEHDRVGDYCRNYVDHSRCLGQVAQAKVLGIALSDILSGTERDKVKRMKITITGDPGTNERRTSPRAP